MDAVFLAFAVRGGEQAYGGMEAFKTAGRVIIKALRSKEYDGNSYTSMSIEQFELRYVSKDILILTDCGTHNKRDAECQVTDVTCVKRSMPAVQM